MYLSVSVIYIQQARMKSSVIPVLPVLLAVFVGAALPSTGSPKAAGPKALRAVPVEASLVAQEASVHPGRPFPVAVRLVADKGWHTYWKNPGDAGLPTTIAWDLPAGFTAGPVQWPAPSSFTEQGFTTYGYEGEAILLVDITPPPGLLPGDAVELRARAGWLACRVECLPGSAELSLRLPVIQGEPAADPGAAGLFDRARARIPKPNPAVKVTAAAAAGALLVDVGGVPGAGASIAFYPAEPGIFAAAAEAETAGTGTASLRIPLAEGGAQVPSRLTGVLVVSTGPDSRAIAVDVPVGAQVPAAPLSARTPLAGILAAVVLAFLGGLLLNLMPCVLPVLSLKVLSLVRNAQAGRKSALAHGLVFSAGVLVSFWLIAGLLVALRAGGQLLGWGFQFQSPGLVAAVALLFFLVALNLFGVFEIGVRLTRAGAGAAGREGWAGSFLSGLLATAVATPCTAPFMGSALGWALSQPVLSSFAVFTALGAGMALPYVVLSAAPGLVKRIPKPGRWMETLRQAMGFPMMATVVWMASVLLSLSGTAALFLLLAAFVAAAAGAWVWGRWGTAERSRGARVAAGVIALILVAGSGVFLVTRAEQAAGRAGAPRTSPGLSPQSVEAWEAWSPERLAALRAEGRPVFVDFSAEWCLTCKVNESVTLGRKAVMDGFRERGVALLKADWTDRNDTIASAIAGYGRAGVPLYVLYGPGAKDPVILPEVLTPAIVRAALEKLPAR
jgi:thiol:disulfide interchange protein